MIKLSDNMKKMLDPMNLVFGKDGKPIPGPDTESEMARIQQLAEEYASSNPEEFQKMNDLSYEELNTDDLVQVADTELQDIEVDQRYNEAEMAALGQLEEMSQEGFTARDKADMAGIEAATNRNLRGQRGAIEQNMQARGIEGSGLDLVAQQQAMQSSIDRQALAGLEKAAMMQDRKRGATMDLGQMSGQLSQRDWQREASKAQAQDVINKFNANNSNKAIFSNNAGQNSTNLYNQTAGQNIMNQNTADRNSHADNAYNARQDAARLSYDQKIEEYNRKRLEEEARKKAKKGKAGAILGTAGAVVGGIYGGPAGASTGAAVGSSLGNAMAANGGKVPGEPNGIDSYEDDNFEVILSPGEVVVPDSISHDPVAVAEFVAHINAAGADGEIPARNPIPQEEPEDDVIGMFIETVNSLSKRRK